MEEIDHYLVLGLNSSEEGAKLIEKEINNAYRKKALELHPDKSKDPDAQKKFQSLQISYQILKDPKARKEFDELLKIRREKVVRNRQYDAKRRRMMSDLEKREKESFVHLKKKVRNDEERTLKKLADEIARIRAMDKKSHVHMEVTRAQEPVKRNEAPNLVGAGFQTYEDSVLDKLKKAAQKQKSERSMKASADVRHPSRL